MFFALVAWCVSGASVWRCVATPIVLGVVASLQFRYSQPLKISALAGASFIVAFVFTLWLVSLWEYMHHDKPFPYYEEGFFAEVFVFPVVFCAMYCPVSALASTVSGWITLAFFNARRVA